MSGERRIHAYLHPTIIHSLIERLTGGRFKRPTSAGEALAFGRDTRNLEFWPARKLGVFDAQFCTYCTAIHESYRYEGSRDERHRWAPIGMVTHLPYPRLDAPTMLSYADLKAWRLEHEEPLIDTVVSTIIRVAGLGGTP